MPLQQSTYNRLTILLLWLLFYATFTLVTPPLLDDADSVHAEVAREMLLRHDWVTLYANGIRYLEKAPILYWSMAASMALFGVSAAAARFPLALTVLALALALESFARRAFSNARAGLYAAIILLSSFGIFIFSRIFLPDTAVCLWLTLALYAFWQTEQHPGPAAPLYRPSSTARLLDRSEALWRDPRISSSLPPVLPTPRNTVILSEVEGPAVEPATAAGCHILAAASSPQGRVLSSAAPNHLTPGQTHAPLLPCLTFAAACALNLLTKGLIGLVFPVGIVIIYLLLTRGPRGAVNRLRQLHPLASLALFLLIALPWHLAIAHANLTQGHPGDLTFTGSHWSVPLPTDGNVHGWAWFYFVNEQLLRYLNLRVPRDYDTVPLALFWGLLLVWLMPWSAFLFHAVAAAVPLRAAAWRNRLRTRTLTPPERTNLFLTIWAALPLLFFSLSTRQEYYVLPSLPPLIVLIAAWLHAAAKYNNAAERPPYSGDGIRQAFGIVNRAETLHVVFAGEAAGRIAVVLLVLAGIASGTALTLALTGTPPTSTTDLAALLQQNPTDYALSFGHFLDLNRAAMGAFRTPLLLTAFALFGSILAHYLLRKRNRPHAANLALAAGAFTFLLAAHLGLQTFAPVLSSQQLAANLAPILQPQDLIVVHGEYEAASTLGFYLKRNDLHILEGRSSNLWYGSFFPDAPAIFETPQTLAAKWASPQRIFLWQSLANDPGPLPPLPTPAFLIAKSGGKEILSNHP